MSNNQTTETVNAKAEQAAFMGRAMERAEMRCSLREFLLEAALEKAESILGQPAPTC